MKRKPIVVKAVPIVAEDELFEIRFEEDIAELTAMVKKELAEMSELDYEPTEFPTFTNPIPYFKEVKTKVEIKDADFLVRLIKAEAPYCLDRFDTYHEAKLHFNVVNAYKDKYSHITEDMVKAYRDAFTKAMLSPNTLFGMRRKYREDSRYTTEKIFDTGFKSQFQSGSSGGCYNHSLRRKLETTLFGEHAEHIYYGYAIDRPSIVSRDASQYGDSIFIFNKEKLKDKVTFTIGDSLGYFETSWIANDFHVDYKDKYAWGTDTGIPSKVFNPSVFSFSLFDINMQCAVSSPMLDLNSSKLCAADFRPYDSFVELQYKDITMDDVEAIVFEDNMPLRSFAKKLNDAGFVLVDSSKEYNGIFESFDGWTTHEYFIYKRS